jgi:2-dehydro-3-deoxyphosphogluconate aldolase / (4S)-4-hydroxy-2-oxoglutarate aldolase
MPTGGVSLTNAGEWIAAGAVAVGVGTALLDPKAIAESRFEVIADNARTVVGAVAAARAKQQRDA